MSLTTFIVTGASDVRAEKKKPTENRDINRKLAFIEIIVQGIKKKKKKITTPRPSAELGGREIRLGLQPPTVVLPCRRNSSPWPTSNGAAAEAAASVWTVSPAC